MPKKFDTSRIYELPVLRHNTTAINLIYKSVVGDELSPEFLKKAIDHSTLLTKLIILDNIPVGCVYSHIDSTNKKTLIIDYICVLKSYQNRGIGTFTLQKLIERTKNELNVQNVVVSLFMQESKEFFIKAGFQQESEDVVEYMFDGRTMKGIHMMKKL